MARQPLHPSPVFVLGHPRTGTTHLHNLLSCDPRFAFATTFHAGGSMGSKLRTPWVKGIKGLGSWRYRRRGFTRAPPERHGTKGRVATTRTQLHKHMNQPHCV